MKPITNQFSSPKDAVAPIIVPWLVGGRNRYRYLLSICKKFVFPKIRITPTYRYFWKPEKPAIFDFYHRYGKYEKTVVCVVNFIYPFHICKIAIVVFLSIYLQSAHGWFNLNRRLNRWLKPQKRVRIKQKL